MLLCSTWLHVVVIKEYQSIAVVLELELRLGLLASLPEVPEVVAANEGAC